MSLLKKLFPAPVVPTGDTVSIALDGSGHVVSVRLTFVDRNKALKKYVDLYESLLNGEGFTLRLKTTPISEHPQSPHD